MPTTPSGLPYPSNTDPLANMAAAMQALATALEPYVQDSGWVDLTNSIAVGAVKYRRRGKWVTVNIVGTATTASGTLYTTVAAGAIPADLRPSRNARGAADYSGYPGTAVVKADGSIVLLHNSGANRTTVEATVVYPVEA